MQFYLILFLALIVNQAAFAQEYKANINTDEMNKALEFEKSKDLIPLAKFQKEKNGIKFRVEKNEIQKDQDKDSIEYVLPEFDKGSSDGCYKVWDTIATVSTYSALSCTHGCVGFSCTVYYPGQRVRLKNSTTYDCYTLRIGTNNKILEVSTYGSGTCSNSVGLEGRKVVHGFYNLKKELSKMNGVSVYDVIHAGKEAPCLKRGTDATLASMSKPANAKFLRDMKIDQVIINFVNNGKDSGVADSSLSYGPEVYDDPIFKVTIVQNSKGECKYADVKQLDDQFNSWIKRYGDALKTERDIVIKDLESQHDAMINVVSGKPVAQGEKPKAKKSKKGDTQEQEEATAGQAQ